MLYLNEPSFGMKFISLHERFSPENNIFNSLTHTPPTPLQHTFIFWLLLV